jgi:replicative DNA helicase
MIIEKQQYWNNIIEHYFDKVHYESQHKNIYDWLEADYGAVSDTANTTIEFAEAKKATWFALRFSK